MRTIDNIEVEDLGNGIYLIETYYRNKKNYAGCYLVECNGEITVIETNTNSAVPLILGAIKKLGWTRDQVKYVILTHIHLDHAGGAGELMLSLPRAELVLHPRGSRHIINPKKLISSVKQIYGEKKYRELYGKIIPVPEKKVINVKDGDVLILGKRQLQVFDTPGHAKHHIIVFDKDTRSVFSGDAFGISYPRFTFNSFRLIFPSTSPTQFDPELTSNTIKKIIELKPSRVLLTHYGAYENITNGCDQLVNWIRFSVEIANRRYKEGYRENKLNEVLLDDIWSYFEREITKFCPGGLKDEEREFLFLDADLNAKGLAHYIQKLNS